MEPFMEPLVLEVSPDRSRLMIAPADGSAMRLDLDAAGADALMRRLSACRSEMTPVHPAEPPADPDRIYRNDNLLIDVRACPLVPAIQVATQHPGLGWTATILSRDQAEDLQAAIDFALRDIPREATAA
jgi:hypothetical protein